MVLKLAADPGDIICGFFTGAEAHKVSAWHAVTGLCTEAGELLEWANSGDMDEANLIEELGDLEWYLRLLSAAFTFPIYLPPEPDYPADGPPTDGGTARGACVSVAIAAARLADVVKRWVVYGSPLNEEAAKSWSYALRSAMAWLRYCEGVTREEVLQANIAKLQQRYPAGGFRKEDSENRDPDKERAAAKVAPTPNFAYFPGHE